jgi:hypothetical protein
VPTQFNGPVRLAGKVFLASARCRRVILEREVLSPPRDEETLRAWAKQLGLKQGSDDWLKLFDYAAVDAGRIPDYVLKGEELVEKLPAFFRTLSGNKPTDEELENLIKLLRER